jgi:hypothetical protein
MPERPGGRISEPDLRPSGRVSDVSRHHKGGPGVPQLGDRELLIALHQLGYTGLITSNYKMLQNP